MFLKCLCIFKNSIINKYASFLIYTRLISLRFSATPIVAALMNKEMWWIKNSSRE